MENENRPHFKPNAVKYTKGYGLSLFISRFITFIIIAASIAAIALSIHIYINQPVKTSDGYIQASPIHTKIELGEQVVIVEAESYGIFTPIKRFLFEQEVYEAKIVAGPYGEIKESNSENVSFVVVYADNTAGVILASLDDLDDQYLDNEYIVRKVDNEGNYIEGEFDNVVTKEEVLGKLKVDENWMKI